MTDAAEHVDFVEVGAGPSLMTHQVILDVDTGIDDALAISFAVAHPQVHVLAIVCVAGNTDVDQVVDNTLRLLDVLGAGPVPVVRGAQRPLLGEPLDATHVHGADGMGDLGLPTPRRVASPLPAIDETRRALQDARGPVTYVCLGPATNLALLLRTHPSVAAKISRIVMMGGAIGAGNASAVAEFNMWHDPEAAHIVTTSGLPVTMFTLDAFHDTAAESQRIDTFRGSGSTIERLVADLLAFRRDDGRSFGLLGDAAVICTVVAPDSARHVTLPVAVDSSCGPGRGQSLVDRRRTAGEDDAHGIRRSWPEIDVIDAADANRLNAIYFATLHAYATTVEGHSRRPLTSAVQSFPGTRRGDPGYETQRRHAVWQSIKPDRHPARLLPVTDQFSLSAMLSARRPEQRFSIISSGHSYIGNGLQDDVTVLDLRQLKAIHVDRESRSARVGPAATNGALDTQLAAAGLAFPVGHSPSVAAGGYLLGGGLGWNPDCWGSAACTGVTGATVILASGDVVHTSAEEQADLFFALRGAGPLFPGIVLEYELACPPRPQAITELVGTYPLGAAGAVASWVTTASVRKSQHVELSAMLSNDGEDVITVSAIAFVDTDAAAERTLGPLLATLPPHPLTAPECVRRTLGGLLERNDAPPQRYSVEGRWLTRPDETLAACAEHFASSPSADSLIHLAFRSTAKLAPNAAFSMASPIFMFSSAVWDDPADDPDNIGWHDLLQEKVSRLTVGYYVNETDYIRHPSHLRRSFSPQAWARIRSVRAKYDPDGVFASPMSVPNGGDSRFVRGGRSALGPLTFW